MSMQGGEDDLDALLARFALDDAQKDAVEILENAACPSARVYASFTAVTPDKVLPTRQSYIYIDTHRWSDLIFALSLRPIG